MFLYIFLFISPFFLIPTLDQNYTITFRIQADYGTVDSVLAIQGDETETIDYNSSKYQLEPTTQIHGFMEESETTKCFVQELYCSDSGNQTSDDYFECCSGKYLGKVMMG